MFRDFSKKYNLGKNDDFSYCRHLFDEYGGTLKDKLEYVFNDFCKTMKYNPIDIPIFYSPSKLDTRLKNARNVVCHGLYENKIDWKTTAKDTLILQELIYYMLLKYKAKIPNKNLRMCLETSFNEINRFAFQHIRTKTKNDNS